MKTPADKEAEMLTANILAFSHAMVDLAEREDWDDNRVLQVVGAWLTFGFNEMLWPEATFRRFVATLVRAHERRTLQ